LKAISLLADCDVDVLVSLGRGSVAAAARSELLRPNIRIVDDVDQWAALSQRPTSSSPTTGSTRPMNRSSTKFPDLVPFFGDQPALARRCQDLGSAVPLTTGGASSR
jgi:hypothetical protein